MDFKILPVGIAEAGAWKYAFIYQVMARHYADIPEQARHIGESQARAKLLELYFDSVGAAQVKDVNKLFGWGDDLTRRAIARMLDSAALRLAEYPAQKGEYLCLPGLCT